MSADVRQTAIQTPRKHSAITGELKRYFRQYPKNKASIEALIEQKKQQL